MQNFEPVFLYPPQTSGLSLRAHFFAPAKYFFGMKISTLAFNLIIIWTMSVVFYITLYYDVLRKIVGTGKGKATSF